MRALNFWQSILIITSIFFVGNKLPAKNTYSEKEFYIKPIGSIQKENNITRLIIEKKYQDGLYGLDKFSHIWVIWWFNQNDNPQQRSVLQVNPREKDGHPKTGIFACRAPVRPNLIAITLCKIKSIKNNIITIEKIDAFDKTPIIDIKPYIAKTDSPDFTWGAFSRKRK
jgi:tRNA (adenine37-N6)-methyltransferase